MSENIKNKLLNFEVPPPTGVWENISQELQESNATLALSQKMLAYEVTPPVATWNLILQHLANDSQPSVIATRKTLKITYKLLVAATFLGVVLAGGLYLNTGSIRKQITGKLLSATQKKRQQLKNLTHRSFPVPDTMLQMSQLSTTSSDYIINRKKTNQLPESTRTLRKAIVSVGSILTPQLSVIIPAKPIRNESGDIIQNFDILNTTSKYINITCPNGEQTRISSKFVHVLLYLNGDSESDFGKFMGYYDLKFFESLIWKSRFKDWRQRIIKTPFIPSSTNFLDILDFKDFLIKEE